MSFVSILFERAEQVDGAERTPAPGYFGDLNLDQVLDAMSAGREEYRLEPYFYRPLHDTAAVRYRHAVLRDLETPAVLETVRAFAQEMRRLREHHAQIEKLHTGLQKQAWFLDAVEIYCNAVRALADDLAGCDVRSAGLDGFRAYLGDYTGSEGFTSLAAETEELEHGFADIRYAVRSHGPHVTVSHYEGEEDYGTQVAETFAKFQQGAAKSYLVTLPDSADMNHVEAQILAGVAHLNPDAFARLADFCTRQRDYLDPTIARLDREVQFYVGYLELAQRLRDAGLPLCYPHVSARSQEIAVDETFDLALALKLVAGDKAVVTNDVRLEPPERVIVVTGPNNGGKTTFARTFGQLHHLASLGLLVPGRRAKLFLPDRIFTHFEREEDIETLRGKFDDELVRVHAILDQATSESVIVLNESFSSTTLDDALFVGSEVMQRIVDRGCLAVYVTFVDELTSFGEATVSMVSQIVPDNPAERTFKVIRTPADGLAYASAIADKYGLSYDRLLERID